MMKLTVEFDVRCRKEIRLIDNITVIHYIDDINCISINERFLTVVTHKRTYRYNIDHIVNYTTE
jgi:hypothetical protein